MCFKCAFVRLHINSYSSRFLNLPWLVTSHFSLFSPFFFIHIERRTSFKLFHRKKKSPPTFNKRFSCSAPRRERSEKKKWKQRAICRVSLNLVEIKSECTELNKNKMRRRRVFKSISCDDSVEILKSSIKLFDFLLSRTYLLCVGSSSSSYEYGNFEISLRSSDSSFQTIIFIIQWSSASVAAAVTYSTMDSTRTLVEDGAKCTTNIKKINIYISWA